MIGIQELIIPLVIIALIALFGRKTIMKILKDIFEVKKDVKKMTKEFEDGEEGNTTKKD